MMKHFNTWKDENNDFYAGIPTPLSFNSVLALAAKRGALGKSQTIACLDVSIAFLHAEMRDEVCFLRMIREENLPNLQPFGGEGFSQSGHSVVRIPRLTTILEGRRGRSSERYWDSNRAR